MARFILPDGKEEEVWDLLRRSGLLVRSDLASTTVRLKEGLEGVKLTHRAVSIDLSRIADVSFL